MSTDLTRRFCDAEKDKIINWPSKSHVGESDLSSSLSCSKCPPATNLDFHFGGTSANVWPGVRMAAFLSVSIQCKGIGLWPSSINCFASLMGIGTAALNLRHLSHSVFRLPRRPSWVNLSALSNLINWPRASLAFLALILDETCFST